MESSATSTKGKVVTNQGTKLCDINAPTLPMDQPLAQVGVTLSAGQATDFSREKVEVRVYITLPSTTDDVSIKKTYDRCYALASEQLKQRLEETIGLVFPGLGS